MYDHNLNISLKLLSCKLQKLNYCRRPLLCCLPLLLLDRTPMVLWGTASYLSLVYETLRAPTSSSTVSCEFLN